MSHFSKPAHGRSEIAGGMRFFVRARRALGTPRSKIDQIAEVARQMLIHHFVESVQEVRAVCGPTFRFRGESGELGMTKNLCEKGRSRIAEQFKKHRREHAQPSRIQGPAARI